ncbi:MAG TPA: DUF4446 family protein [Candidatus Pacearchaeota archaeon]|nr:DUF4446 family protein [Candidatus Pacearchaeota archaeon]HOL90564.1 DUF4446 family protein [Candidatus Pacearchaeota archaeon]
MFKFSKENKKLENAQEILNYIKKIEQKVESIDNELKDLKENNKYCFKKIGILRFNPFESIGSNQSFTIALLNEKNDGVVITSIYARDENRVYAKPIKDGKSEYTLSEEEKEAIEKAINEK